MSEPTQYDLVQDARLDAHERLITPQDRERYGIEYSFPVVGQQVSDDEFQQMMLSTAAGILDQGGKPFWLKNFDDASRTAQLTVSTTTKDAKAAINGFFYRLVQDMTISLPMPSTPTTYHVCLTYDPLEHGRQSGPISVQTYAGPPPYRDGLLHVELWTVECKPSQLLSDAKVVQKRPKISPTIHVDYPESMPDPRTQLWGATCYIRLGREAGTTYVATGSSEETGGPTLWRALPSYTLTEAPSSPGSAYMWEKRYIERDGKRRRLYGRVRRDNGQNFTTTNSGWGVHAFTEGDFPSSRLRYAGAIAGSGTSTPSFAKATVNSNGIYIYPQTDSPWFDFNGFTWYVD